jgi:hypothetical protein
MRILASCNNYRLVLEIASVSPLVILYLIQADNAGAWIEVDRFYNEDKALTQFNVLTKEI